MNKQSLNHFFEDNYTGFKNYLGRRFNTLSEYDVEDIVQQTVLKLLYKGDDVFAIGNLTSYMYTSLHNNAVDYFKANHKYKLDDQMHEDIGVTLDEEMLLKELKQVIKEGILQLDPKTRFVFIETEIKGRSYESLVKQTGEKLGTLLSRKNRGKKKLQKIVNEYLRR